MRELMRGLLLYEKSYSLYQKDRYIKQHIIYASGNITRNISIIVSRNGPQS